jgi:hypothetical protein
VSTVYGEYAKDRSGWFLGMSGTQLTVVLVAGVPVLAAVNANRWPLLAVWVPVWVLVVCLVVVPVRGRSATGWLVAVAAHALGGVMGWTSWQSKVAAGQPGNLAEADLPGVLAGVEIYDGPPFGAAMTRVAVIQDHAARTWAGTAKVTHPGIGFAETQARDRFGQALAELAEMASRSDIIDRVTFTVRTVPDDGAERADWVRRHRRDDAPDLSRQVNQTLSAQLMPASVRHEAFVTVVGTEHRLAKAAGRSGRGISGRARVLYGALGEVGARLESGLGATTVTWLDTAALAVAIRTGFAPGDRAALAAADLAGRHDPDVATGVPLAAAGPSSANAADLRHYEHDAWASCSDTILLPDQGAVMGAIAPILAPSTPGERRSLTVCCQVFPQHAADRVTGREEASADAGSGLRDRLGLAERARQRRERAQVYSTDDKLARGRALVRVTAVAAITVPKTWEVAEFGRRLDESVRLAGFTPQRLDAAQPAAFVVAAIPLGVGMPQRRGIR